MPICLKSTVPASKFVNVLARFSPASRPKILNCYPRRSMPRRICCKMLWTEIFAEVWLSKMNLKNISCTSITHALSTLYQLMTVSSIPVTIQPQLFFSFTFSNIAFLEWNLTFITPSPCIHGSPSTWQWRWHLVLKHTLFVWAATLKNKKGMIGDNTDVAARKRFETKMTSTKESSGDPFDAKWCPAAYDWIFMTI